MRFAALIRTFAAAGMLALTAIALPAWGQTRAPVAQPAAAPAVRPAAVAALDPLKLDLDQAEATAKREGLSVEMLADLRGQVASVRDQLRGQIDTLEPRLADIDKRLEQLGDPPAAGQPAEDAAIAGERDRLNRTRVELDVALKQARFLTTRAEELGNRLTERRRQIFTRELLERGSSILDPLFWADVGKAARSEASSLVIILQAWWDYAHDNGRWGGAAAAALTLLAFAGAALALRRWWRRALRDARPADKRFGKAAAALAVLVQHSVTMPLTLAAVVLVLDAYGLLPPRIVEIASGLLVAVTTAAFGRGAALGLLAPHEPARRLIALDDETALSLTRHVVPAARGLGVAIFLNTFHRAVVAPLSLTVATSALLALFVAIVIVHGLLRLRPRSEADGDVRGQWIRAVAWVIVAAIAIALSTGYIGLAAFIAGRFLTILAIGAVLSIALVFVDALFSEVLTGDSPRGRALAATFGLRARGVELIGTLLSALIRVVLVLLAIYPAIGPGAIFAADFFGAVTDAVFGFRIGEVTISLTNIIGALALIVIGVLLTRAAQRWLEMRFLPRTGLEPSLQHSISAIFGYCGFITVLVIGLAHIGIDLQKIALIAGALSVGIGFGLQSIVSNFVSGLILLAERPIRVGDSIVVKGEEGWVRRIRVRSTEIETFERATVIVPNSELITGVVKNWTHANTMGRLIIKVGVAYDSDPQQVHDILMACATEHPQVLQSPPVRVLLTNFGDSALEFELRCLVSNIDFSLVVKSEINFAILRRFREAGIEIPFPQREIRLLADKAPPSTPTRPAPAGPRLDDEV